ncbi:hypothetical protein PROFUN_02206 [Planoprotostelium fungivorum]|uniref:Uncharacterized protein n=1 Tax=Planoprotostelium fungivorum TaxID=1890364 RepID=A0A2P6NZG3_9EUKA|nr:hypothetical protein PROFUN_02206 [Planoprotostelium fungivorum]
MAGALLEYDRFSPKSADLSTQLAEILRIRVGAFGCIQGATIREKRS